MFGKLIRRERERLGLTLAQLAEASDLPLGSVRNYESGRRTPPLPAALALARALAIDCGILTKPSRDEAVPVTLSSATARVAAMAKSAEEMLDAILGESDLRLAAAAALLAAYFKSSRPVAACPLPHGPSRCPRCGGAFFLSAARYAALPPELKG